jgi:hypothetical protein
MSAKKATGKSAASRKQTPRRPSTPPATGTTPAGAVNVDAGGRPVVDDDGRPDTTGGE